METVYKVYWTETDVDEVRSADFAKEQMTNALDFMEDLRQKQRLGELIRFITMVSEHPDSVGHPGVGAAPEGYNWPKRRDGC